MASIGVIPIPTNSVISPPIVSPLSVITGVVVDFDPRPGLSYATLKAAPSWMWGGRGSRR
jgi:hypothetical protein